MREIFHDPRHPYTQALMSAIPIPDPERPRQRIILRGDVPSPVDPPSGCRFHPRCWLRERLGNPEINAVEEPQLRQISSGQWVACHFAEESTRQLIETAHRETDGIEGSAAVIS